MEIQVENVCAVMRVGRNYNEWSRVEHFFLSKSKTIYEKSETY